MIFDPLFEELLRTLEPEDAALDVGLRRAERVARILENDRELSVLATRLGGSCAKRTAIHPVEDVDLFVYLDAASWVRTDGQMYQPHTVLRTFHEWLERTFRKPVADGDVSLRRQDHSVRVRYIKEGALAIDVVPVLWADQNRAEIVKIPERSSREWRETCVTRQSLLLDKHDAPNRYLRRGIRLLKHWRTKHRVELPSYALEVLALHAVRRIDAKHPRAVFLSVLGWIAETELGQPAYLIDYVPAGKHRIPRDAEVVILDAAVAGNNVTGELRAGHRRAIVAAARRSLDRLRAAAHHLNRGARREAGVAFRAAFSRAVSVRRPGTDDRGALSRPAPASQGRGFWAWLTG